MKLVLIGSGNVAFHLGKIFLKNGHSILQVYNRRSESGPALAKQLKCDYTDKISGINRNADLYVVMLADEAIEKFLKKLDFIPKLIVHTSGTTGLDVFPSGFRSVGVFYPVQTFSSKSRTSSRFPICIEASDKRTEHTVKKLARSVSDTVVSVNTEDRRILHLAAVLANNFSNYLFTLAQKLLASRKLNFDLLLPIIDETLEKIHHENPHDVQTGPARRGDQSVIRTHLQLLDEFPEMKVIYNAMSKSLKKEYRNDN